MTIINTGENQIKWTVRKGLSSVNEDFTRSDVMLFAISQTNKIPLPITSKEKGVIVATIPHVVPATQEHPEYAHRGIQEDTYDVELVWIKNKRELNRTYLHNAFRVSDNQLIPTLTVEIVSTAQSYGYDGLSAYEIAMFRRLSEGESAICENQWLEDLLAEKANTTDLNAEITNRLTADSTLSGRIDSEVTDRQEEDIRLNNRIQAEANVRSVFDNNILALVNDINYKIPEGASDTNKLTDKQYVDNQMAQKANISYVDDNFATKQALNQEAFERGQKDNLLDNKIDGVSTRVGTVERLIPTEADPNNMLADKEFVNSSVSTNTATFKGSYNLVTDLGLSAGATNSEIAQALLVAASSCDNNDYCFTAVPVSNETPTTIKEVRRFKYNETNNSWVYEYTLNNSGFTAAQWAAILSGITSTLVNKLTTLPTNNLLTSRFNEKLDVLVSGSNIKSINGKSVLGSGNLEIKDILLVLYNSTSYNDIAQAYISGKMVFSLDLPNGRLYTLTSITNDGATFTSFDCDAHSFHSFVVNSSNVYSAVVTTPIQEELAFDNDPTLNSTNPVTSDGIKRAADEILLRTQGISEHYNGDTDPILRKRFPEDAPEGVDSYKYAIKQTNDFLNEQYFAIHDNRYYRGQENQGPKEIGISELRTICQNMVHIDITGGCLWVMNMPFAFATGSFRQIAFGAEPYSSTEAGYEVTGGIRVGRHVLQRMSTYDFNTGIVTWSEWKEIISDLDTIRNQASGALQRNGGNNMTGDLDLNDHALLVRTSGNQPRRGIQFTGEGVRLGIYVGNPSMRLFLEADPNLDLIHKKGGDFYDILDTNNVATKGNIYQTTWGDTLDNIINAANAGKIVILKRDITYNEQKYSPTYVLNCFVKRVSDDYITECRFYARLEDNVVAEIACKRGPTWVDNGVIQLQENLVSGTNIKTINNQSVLGSGNLDVKDVFWVEYEETPFADILAAYNAGKVLFAKYAGYKFVNVGVREEKGSVVEFFFNLPFADENGISSLFFTVTSNNEATDYSNLELKELQEALNSGTNIKTINGNSILGSGDITIDVSQFVTRSVNDLTYYTTSSDLETALSGKLSTLTFDNTPTLNSNNPVTSNGVKSADNEVLLRMLGKSEHYDGYNDPILRKEFVGNSELDPEIRRKETLQRVNNYLDQLYYAIINGLCYRGFDDGQPKPLSEADRLAISHGLIHMDISGGCIWVINAPYNFSTGSFRQIALGVQNYSYSAQESDAIDVTVTNGIDIGNKILQRLSTYNTSTGEVTWTNWSELIDVSRYITSQQLTTALLQFALSVLGALDGKQDTISDLATIRSNASGAVQKSGDTMQGSLVLGIGASSSNKLKFNDDRDFARFSSNAFIVGDPNILLKLETSNVDLKHRYTENNSTSEYAMLDEGNTKTINSSSLYGSGDLLLYTVSDVKANLEAMFTALVSAGVIQNYTLTDPASGSKTFGFSFT